MHNLPPGPRFSLLQTALFMRDPNGFYAVDDVQAVEAGVFPSRRPPRWILSGLPRLFRSAA